MNQKSTKPCLFFYLFFIIFNECFFFFFYFLVLNVFLYEKSLMNNKEPVLSRVVVHSTKKAMLFVVYKSLLCVLCASEMKKVDLL